MGSVDQALETVTYWLRALLGLFISLFAVIEDFLHHVLGQVGVPGGIQQIVILVVLILFIVAVLRAFGGVLRILLMVFLLLFLLHAVMPDLHI